MTRLIHESAEVIDLIADQNGVGVMELNGESYAVIERPDGERVAFTTAAVDVPAQRSAS